MRIVVAPFGTRGDVQPILALAIGLRTAGHEVSMVASPNYADEARAFDVPFAPLGEDMQTLIRRSGFESSPLRGGIAMFDMGRRLVGELTDGAMPLMRGADLIVGGGTPIFAPTAAEALGVPYAWIAYSSQAFRSAHHAPFTVPIHDSKPPMNRLLWRAMNVGASAAIGGPLARKRAELGLGAVDDLYEHLFSARTALLAADPELVAVPPDIPLAEPPTGSLHLPDLRPLDDDLERFLSTGPTPLYVGFGSMLDADSDATTVTILKAAELARCRLVVSAGWARYGRVTTGTRRIGQRAIFIGATSHSQLFPRVAGIVHHGGAGTTSAALRSGRPQLVVPHLFDQFLWAKWAFEAGVAPRTFTRAELTTERLAAGLRAMLDEPRFSERAATLGAKVRARDSTKTLIGALERIASRSR